MRSLVWEINKDFPCVGHCTFFNCNMTCHWAEILSFEEREQFCQIWPVTESQSIGDINKTKTTQINLSVNSTYPHINRCIPTLAVGGAFHTNRRNPLYQIMNENVTGMLPAPHHWNGCKLEYHVYVFFLPTQMQKKSAFPFSKMSWSLVKKNKSYKKEKKWFWK